MAITYDKKFSLNPLESGLVCNFQQIAKKHNLNIVSIPLNRVWFVTLLNLEAELSLMVMSLNPLESGLVCNEKFGIYKKWII